MGMEGPQKAGFGEKVKKAAKIAAAGLYLTANGPVKTGNEHAPNLQDRLESASVQPSKNIEDYRNTGIEVIHQGPLIVQAVPKSTFNDDIEATTKRVKAETAAKEAYGIANQSE